MSKPKKLPAWKRRDRALALRAKGYFRADVRPHPEIPGLEVVGLQNGTGKEPTIYVRLKLPLQAVLRGRKATLPWRKVS